MHDIDGTLARLRNLPVDPRLAAMDEAVLNGLNRELAWRNRPSGGLYATAAAVALVTGVLGSAVPGGSATTATNPFPLGAAVALAPSTLLAAAR
ncbi:MAG: hypothetical protein ABIT10_06700 [Alteraurantiacibacter sp.]